MRYAPGKFLGSSTKKNEIRIDEVQFKQASSQDEDLGLLGWITCRLNGSIQLAGLALRRTRDGRCILSFPARKDLGGNRHFFYRPLNDSTRKEIQCQIFGALRIRERSA